MRIWLDLHNSPHPLLFAPVVRRLEEQGHRVLVTARDNAQTVELAYERWPHTEVIGGSSPRGRRAKAQTLGRRIADLRHWAARERPDVALSHNSYAQIVAARARRLPVVTAMDFEHQPANHLAFRLAHRVLLPEALRSEPIRRQGATPAKTVFYPGLKEELYLGDFEPDHAVLEHAGVRAGGDDRLVVARTPPDRALYHRVENSLFVEALRTVGRRDRVVCVVLTRNAAQRSTLQGLALEGCVLPSASLDSRSLMYRSDLVLGAGGTMTREAALLGVPTFSLFAGQEPAVDRWLAQQGMLSRLVSVAQLEGVLGSRPRPRSLTELRARSEPILSRFVEETVATGAG